VENGVHYVQRNFMAGQEFVDIQAANVHLRGWVMNTAGYANTGQPEKRTELVQRV